MKRAILLVVLFCCVLAGAQTSVNGSGTVVVGGSLPSGVTSPGAGYLTLNGGITPNIPRTNLAYEYLITETTGATVLKDNSGNGRNCALNGTNVPVFNTDGSISANGGYFCSTTGLLSVAKTFVFGTCVGNLNATYTYAGSPNGVLVATLPSDSSHFSIYTNNGGINTTVLGAVTTLNGLNGCHVSAYQVGSGNANQKIYFDGVNVSQTPGGDATSRLGGDAQFGGGWPTTFGGRTYYAAGYSVATLTDQQFKDIAREVWRYMCEIKHAPCAYRTMADNYTAQVIVMGDSIGYGSGTADTYAPFRNLTLDSLGTWKELYSAATTYAAGDTVRATHNLTDGDYTFYTAIQAATNKAPAANTPGYWLPTVHVQNMSVYGQSLEQIEAAFDTYLDPYMATIAPNYYYSEAITNDMVTGEPYIAGLRQLNLARRAIKKGVRKAMVQTMLARNASGTDLNPKKNIVNPYLIQMAPMLGIGVCNAANDALLGADGAENNGTYFVAADKTHLMNAGRDVLAADISRCWNAYFFGRDTWAAARTASGTYSELDSDVFLKANGTFTITLVSAQVLDPNQKRCIANVGSGTITMDGAGTETIGGSATATIAAGATTCRVPLQNDAATGGAVGWIIVP